MSEQPADQELLMAAGAVVDNFRQAMVAEELDELNPVLFKRLGELVDVRRGQGQYNHELLARVASILANPPLAGRYDAQTEAGNLLMLQDLLRLAKDDGCIAAAWALEHLCGLTVGETG